VPSATPTGTLERPAGSSGPPPAAASRWRSGGQAAWRTLLAAVAGLLLLLAFPGSSLPLLAPLGPAALALAVHGQRARAGAWLGLVCGLCSFVPLLSWSGIFVGALPWLALAASQAAFVALLGAATAATSRLPLWPLWAAALWVASEALRGRFPFGGFPWGRLGLSQTEGPFLAFAAYGGVPLVGFAVALTGTLLAAAVLRLLRGGTAGRGPHRGRRARRPGARRAGLAAAARVLAHRRRADPDGGGGPGRRPAAGLEFNERRRAVLDNHVDQTVGLAEAVAAGEQPQPDLVVWPENSSDIDPYRNDDAAAQISRAAQAIGGADPGRRRGQRPGGVHQQHRHRLGPRDRAR
jgi:apolipoprotein N-acyltransferase